MCRSRIPMPLQRRCFDSWITTESGTRCESGPTFTRAKRYGPRPRRSIWRVFSAPASSAHCSQGRHRRTMWRQALSMYLPALNTAHMLSLTDDTGILQHAIFSVPNSNEGYTTDDNARALDRVVLPGRGSGATSGQRWNIRTCLIAIWPSYGLPSKPIPEGSGTFSAMTAGGWKTLDRTIAMAAPCGRLGRCSDIRRTRD